MFLHCFKYTFLNFLRTKVIIFWVVLFPMLLGTFFNFAFMNIYDSTEIFKEIPVAVVNGCEQGGVKSLLDGMSGDIKFIKAQYTDEKTALELLKNSEVDGVIYDDLIEPKLSVRSGGGMNASILKVFLDRYKTNAQIIVDIIKTDPERITDVIDAMQEETVECLELKELSSGNLNPYVSYMYNLLAMSCLFVSMIGQYIAINNQANLSAVGARSSVSPVSKAAQTTAGILAAFVIFFTGIAVATAYLFFVLKIDFGIGYGEALLVNAVGVIFGLSMGFFIGSIGRMGESMKMAILLLVSLGTGFLSGLMAGDMPNVIEKNCPIINRINPSRLISDSYYAISSYGFGGRLARNLITLAAMAVLFMIGGCLLTRKRKFKNL